MKLVRQNKHRLYRSPLIFWALLLVCYSGLSLVGCDSPEDAVNDPANPATATDPASLVKSAEAKQTIGAFDSAIAELNRAITADPGFVPAYFLMGKVYNEAGQREQAVTAFQKTLELDPKHFPARMALASVFNKMGRDSLALTEYLAAVEVRPQDPEVYFKIALEYWYMQQLENCAEAYRKVIELKSDHLQAHLNLASVYEAMKDWDPALREIGLSIQLAQSTGNTQAVSIAENKLKFFKGRANMTEADILEKTSPPFN